MIVSLILMLLMALVVFLSNQPGKRNDREISNRTHIIFCCIFAAIGIFLRLWKLGSLPDGFSPEEALTGVQARVFFETRGFMPTGRLTTYLPQWSAESNGTLLAILSAPMVGLFGLNTWTLRLPLVIISLLAGLAAYGAALEISGKRAARFMLMIYMISPFFVLGSRMAYSAFLAAYLLPMALYGMVRGVKSPRYSYLGMGLTALLCYTQEMYLFIAPVMVVVFSVLIIWKGASRKHGIGASLLGLLLCAPGVLTLWVNLFAKAPFTLLGVIDIPYIEGFVHRNILLPQAENPVLAILSKTWSVLMGGIFQVVRHDNISSELFAPTSMNALYLISVPLIVLGAAYMVVERIDGKKPENRMAAVIVGSAFGVSLLGLVLFGNLGYMVKNGCTSILDDQILFFFAAMLMTKGLCGVAARSAKGTLSALVLIAASVCMLGVHLLGEAYPMNANTYFPQYRDAVKRAKAINEETDCHIGLTTAVYPHVAPSQAAEMLALCSMDASAEEMLHPEKRSFDMIYISGESMPEKDWIYVAMQKDVAMWDLEGYNYEEYGEYAVISPIAAE